MAAMHGPDAVSSDFCRWSLGYQRRITSCCLGLLITRFLLSPWPSHLAQ